MRYETTGTVIDPLTVADAKEHLRVTHTSDDTYIELLVQAAREAAEAYLGRALVAQTVKYYPESWPAGKTICLPMPQLISLTSVAYVDKDGANQTIDTGNFYTDAVSVPGRIKLKDAESWPDISRDVLTPITITFQAGWADTETVPALIVQGLKEHVADMYVNRTPVNMARDGRIAVQVPAPLHRLYSRYRARA